MDPLEDLRKLYEKLPPGSAFRSTIERALGIAEKIEEEIGQRIGKLEQGIEKITGIPLTSRKESPPPAGNSSGEDDSQTRAAEME